MSSRFGLYIPSNKAVKNKAFANGKKQFAKEQYTKEKLKTAILNQKRVSKHQQKLIDQYSKTMSGEDAELAAYKRVKTERALAIVGGLTISAAIAYGAYRHHDWITDKIIESGTTINNVSGISNKGVEDAFYSSFGKDSNKYVGLLGKTRQMQGKPDIYQMSAKASRNMKIASDKTGYETLKKMYEDPANRKEIQKFINNTAGGTTKQIATVAGAKLTNKSNKLTKAQYKAFNLGLVGNYDNPTVKNFYGKLKESGYDGIVDYNDRHMSGYNTKTANIIFNGKNSLSSIYSTKISNADIDKNYNKEITKILAKKGAIYGGAYAAYKKRSH